MFSASHARSRAAGLRAQRGFWGPCTKARWPRALGRRKGGMGPAASALARRPEWREKEDSNGCNCPTSRCPRVLLGKTAREATPGGSRATSSESAAALSHSWPHLRWGRASRWRRHGSRSSRRPSIRALDHIENAEDCQEIIRRRRASSLRANHDSHFLQASGRRCPAETSPSRAKSFATRMARMCSPRQSSP